ncbi:MAG: TrmH family RNA methyltransferase [Thermoguttaceae bacterium]
MNVERIDSLEDPRVAAFRNLRDRTLRGESLFVAEGPAVARRLLASRYQTESVLVAPRWAEEFQQLAGSKAPVYVAAEPLLRQIVGYPFHLGVLAAGRRPAPECLEELLAGKQTAPELTLVICPEITKPENMGLVFRAAGAFGVDGVLVGPRCCDPFSRRSLRVSMGAVLHVPLARSADLGADLGRLKSLWRFELLAAVVDRRAEQLAEVQWPPRAGILLGNETAGLRPEWLALCDRRVTIPMQPNVDSLNLGTAAAIFLYQRTFHGRQ